MLAQNEVMCLDVRTYYHTPATIDESNPCGKNCYECIGTSCKQDRCFGEYYNSGDRCKELNAAWATTYGQCKRYDYTKTCVECFFGFYYDSGICSKCHSTCLTCMGPNENQCLVCADPDLHTNANILTPTGGTCGTTCVKTVLSTNVYSNCNLCGGNMGCWKCNTGYAKWLATSGTFTGKYVCVKMSPDANGTSTTETLDYCLTSADSSGKFCEQCDYQEGYFMKNQLNCSKAAKLISAIFILITIITLSSAFLY